MPAEHDRPSETNERGGFLLRGLVELVEGVTSVASWGIGKVAFMGSRGYIEPNCNPFDELYDNPDDTIAV